MHIVCSIKLLFTCRGEHVKKTFFHVNRKKMWCSGERCLYSPRKNRIIKISVCVGMPRHFSATFPLIYSLLIYFLIVLVIWRVLLFCLLSLKKGFPKIMVMWSFLLLFEKKKISKTNKKGDFSSTSWNKKRTVLHLKYDWFKKFKKNISKCTTKNKAWKKRNVRDWIEIKQSMKQTM